MVVRSSTRRSKSSSGSSSGSSADSTAESTYPSAPTASSPIPSGPRWLPMAIIAGVFGFVILVILIIFLFLKFRSRIPRNPFG